MPIKKEIIYPIFLECCQYTDDLFWIYIFEDLSYGKCPYGCYINKNFLCCSFKGKEFSYKIDSNKDPKVMFEEIYNLLHNKLGFYSEIQRRSKIKNIEIPESNWKDKKWNNIKNKNVKDFIIDNYVISMKKLYSLDDNTVIKLKFVILSGIIFKTISNNDIVYENGIIKEIKGISFKKNEMIIDKNLINYKFQNEKIVNKNIKKSIRDYHVQILKQEEEEEI